jgi:hypothetical protein
VPLVPDVPLEPEEPELPEEPEVFAVIKLVPTPADNVGISRKAPLAVPPCSKNLNLFCQMSIVTPLPVIVELV